MLFRDWFYAVFEEEEEKSKKERQRIDIGKIRRKRFYIKYKKEWQQA